jgi:hypothetical protein
MARLRLILAACLGFAALTATVPAFAEPAAPAKVEVPHDGDRYSALVARAEADDHTIDFVALRTSWLESKACKRAASTRELAQVMQLAGDAQDNATVRGIATQIVSIAYVDMSAHKFLRQSCLQLKDQACADHEHFVEFGLLNSIVTNGNGRSADTAWKVISIEEEYFIMRMAGMQLRTQSLINDKGRVFDRMDVTTQDGKQLQLWFDIGLFFGHEL